jgi:hypothetical protein
VPGSHEPCHRTLAKIRIGCLFQGATNLLENNLPPNSCEGDPAPNLTPAATFPNPPAEVAGIGNRIDPLEGGSMGEVAAVEEPERGGCEVSWGR